MKQTTQTTEVKTIDINAMEWFDKINGNSYFAGNVTVNFGMDNEIKIWMPFQYGYGNQYEHEAKVQLHKQGYLPGIGEHDAIWRYCQDNNIILRSNKAENCKKKELTNITKFIALKP